MYKIGSIKMLVLSIILITLGTSLTGCEKVSAQNYVEHETAQLIVVPTKTVVLEDAPEPTSTPTPNVNEVIEKPTPTATATEYLTPTGYVEILETKEIELKKVQKLENGIVLFGESYKELPETCYINDLIKPDHIIIHTDDQSGDYPERWETIRTYWGLGQTKSVHFAVSQDGVLQMLPMYEEDVMHCIGTMPQYDDNGIWHDYNARSIQIEMGGRNYNYMVTGTASSKMVEVIEITTEKTINLVIELMDFYDIPIENILGHYHVGRGKTDPGDLYFEQYFIPNLIKTYEETHKTEGTVNK